MKQVHYIVFCIGDNLVKLNGEEFYFNGKICLSFYDGKGSIEKLTETDKQDLRCKLIRETMFFDTSTVNYTELQKELQCKLLEEICSKDFNLISYFK